MKRPITRRGFLKDATVAGSAAALLPASFAEAATAEPRAAGEREIVRAYERQAKYEEVSRLPVYRARIEPHWFADESRFWYRNDGPAGAREFVLVDAEKGVRKPAFDHARLAEALGKAAGEPVHAASLPFESVAFADDVSTVRFEAGGKAWQCDLATYDCKAAPQTAAAPEAPDTPPQRPFGRGRGRRRGPGGESPDGKWTAFVRDHDVWLREGGDGGKETRLTKDGTAERTYGGLHWSPDSRRLAGFRIHPVDVAPVYMVESTPKSGGMRGVLHQHEYAQPGDPFPTFEPVVFDVATGTMTAAQVDPIDFGEEPPDVVWSGDGSAFLYEKTDRGHQRFRVLRVDAGTGRATAVVDEQAKTFINTSNAYTWYSADASELLYVSEQDGWRHIYLYDAVKGGLKNRVTTGEWVVREIERADEETRQIWFLGSGRNPGENPYHLHHYRVNFDGTGLVALTDGDGTHTVQYSPGRHAYLIDSYSRPDQPPVHTLRRASDGAHVCDLETADARALTSAGWRAPEVFRAKGRDGETDIWGLVFRPTDFDPKKRYPVIENIYAGPQDSFVRQSFAVHDGMQSLAELGFIVVQCDGMGTRNRSKAFHDVCWRNLKDAGLPDRIAWIKALGKKYPYVDTTRVGIYGTSAGGQSSTGAVLFHPEFYKVAVSSCGCHDNRIDKRWWNEQWMGYPVGPWYGESSNIDNAANLRGKLLLIVGELDSNVPPESTIRLTDALMKADKDFELIVITGSDHTSGGAYGERRRRDFFVRHLLGIEPPDRNAPKPPVTSVTLKPRPLGDEALAQTDGGPDTTIEFRNDSPDDISLFWLPGDGRHVPYGTVDPGGRRILHTYAGHWWLVTGKGGKPIAVYVGDARPGIAEIGSAGDGKKETKS